MRWFGTDWSILRASQPSTGISQQSGSWPWLSDEIHEGTMLLSSSLYHTPRPSRSLNFDQHYLSRKKTSSSCMSCIVSALWAARGSENPYKGRKPSQVAAFLPLLNLPLHLNVSKMAVLAPVSCRQGKVLEEKGLSLSSVAIDSKHIVILCGKTIKMSQ